MSIHYCDKHDRHTDLDEHSEGCRDCEDEVVERLPLRMRARIVRSTVDFTLLSIRLEDLMSGAMQFRAALGEAGFQAGDVVDIILAERKG
jgi:hypothetical protein